MTLDAGATTAVLARGLVDRKFTRALLRGRPQRLTPAARAAAAAVDAARLALFAGFITKVRHTDLFEHLPGTLGLLRHYGLEIEVFRDYYLERDPQPRGDTNAKVAAVTAHFMRFAATRRGRTVAGLADVLSHERCQWEVRRAVSQGAPIAGAFTGPVRVARLGRDPYEVMAATARGERWRGRTAVRWWLYWADVTAGELRVIEIDREVAAVIRAILPAALAAGPPRRTDRKQPTGRAPRAGSVALRVPARRRAAIVARLAEAGVLRREGGT